MPKARGNASDQAGREINFFNNSTFLTIQKKLVAIFKDKQISFFTLSAF